MIATHNIKVNGRWYAAGETIPEEKPEEAKAQDLLDLADGKAETEEAVEANVEVIEAETAKPKRTSTRRKKTGE